MAASGQNAVVWGCLARRGPTVALAVGVAPLTLASTRQSFSLFIHTSCLHLFSTPPGMASSSSSSPELPVSRSAHANSSLRIEASLREVLEDLSRSLSPSMVLMRTNSAPVASSSISQRWSLHRWNGSVFKSNKRTLCPSFGTYSHRLTCHAARHWYYEDFVREQDPSLPTMTLKRFSNSLFHVCPLLSHWGNEHEQTFQSFMAYKTRVPVCGAIMLNETGDKVRKILIVYWAIFI